MDINCDTILGINLFTCDLQFKTWRVRGRKAIQLSGGWRGREIHLFYFYSKFGGDLTNRRWLIMAKCRLSLVKKKKIPRLVRKKDGVFVECDTNKK